jgi:hypothetical protein
MKTLLLISTLLAGSTLAPALAQALAQDAQPKQPTVVLAIVNSQLIKYLSFAPANATPYVSVFVLNGKADGYRVNITYVGLADAQPHTASQDIANGRLAYFPVDAVTVTTSVSPYIVSMQSITASVP